MARIDLDAWPLDPDERGALVALLGGRARAELSLSDVWALLDAVWDDMGCSNTACDWALIGRYYEHPVWLLNGMFVEQDPESMGHRHAIADWIAKRSERVGWSRVLDYGGGFGTLARLIAAGTERLEVDVLEPHPSRIGRERVAGLERVHFVSDLQQAVAPWDCLVSTDVLEHVGDPLETLAAMRDAVRPGGCLLLANNFEPVIQCHLPATFHLRPTFEGFALALGLVRAGRIHGSHAVIYRRTPASWLQPPHLRTMEGLSRRAFPVLDRARRRVQQWRARARSPGGRTA